MDKWKSMAEELLNKVDIKINGSRQFDIQVNNEDFYRRVFTQGSLGLGESYMDGWWECEKLDDLFFRILRGGLDREISLSANDVFKHIVYRFRNMQTKKRAWIVGEEHYDLGNDLFELMLDPYMQYSCGYWKEADSLARAQEAKLDLICRKLQLQPGMRLLDIGCGWGGLASYAAHHYDVSVTGVTISKEQHLSAQQRCSGKNINIVLKDYRDINDQFDRIVSVGMFEHVGPKNYPIFFDVVRRNLNKEGIFLLHTIGSNRNKINTDQWIEKYIFPNGVLPSLQMITSASENKFIIEDIHNFGADYDRTLMAWHTNFTKAWPELESNYKPRFRRMFSYYLNSCAGAFRARDIQLWQIIFSPEGVTGGVISHR